MTIKSKIFYTDIYKEIENKIKILLNKEGTFLSHRTIDSTRAVGDAIEGIIAEKFEQILGDLLKEYSSKFARRAMADLAFIDKNDCCYIIDVKTHRLDTKFNMPNLTSVECLSRLYEDDKNYFCILKVGYKVEALKVMVNKITFVPIEFFSWNCLTLGALGWGQIRIANANTVTLTPNNKRKNWIIEMCDNLLSFYPKEILKINDRIDYFKKVKKYWKDKKENRLRRNTAWPLATLPA